MSNDNGGSQLKAQRQAKGVLIVMVLVKGCRGLILATTGSDGSSCCARVTAMVVQIG